MPHRGKMCRMGIRTPEIKVKPDVLKWAREAMGFDVPTAAKKLSIKPTLVSDWEQKEQPISIARLRKVANVYKRSLAVFLLPNAPHVATFPPDFRTLDSVKTDTLSPETRLAIRKAQRNREFFIELLESLNQKYKRADVSFSLEDSPSDLAAKFRKKVGVELKTQFGWDDKAAALKEWISVVESLGILVFQMPMPIKELRAFCLRDRSLPLAVVLNTKDDPHGRIFSLLHEVSHLLIKQSDIDRLTARKGEAEGHKIVEWFANSFAGSFLVPEISLLEDRYAKRYLETKSDGDLARLRGLYKVSPEVILRRFLELGRITEKEYREKKILLEQEMDRYRERQEKKNKEKGGFRNVSMESFQRAGPLLTGKTFTAMNEGRIAGADVARFYEIKQTHIAKIKTILDKRKT